MNFWKNLIGNYNAQGEYLLSTKKMWNTIMSLIAMVVPVIGLFSGKVAWDRFLTYLQIVLPTLSITYVVGKSVDKTDSPPDLVQSTIKGAKGIFGADKRTGKGAK